MINEKKMRERERERERARGRERKRERNRARERIRSIASLMRALGPAVGYPKETITL